jgi:hypothetical protein
MLYGVEAVAIAQHAETTECSRHYGTHQMRWGNQPSIPSKHSQYSTSASQLHSANL